MCPAKIQKSLHICAIWSESSLSALCKISSCIQGRLWSDCVGEQIDLNLHWKYKSKGMFNDVVAHLSLFLKCAVLLNYSCHQLKIHNIIIICIHGEITEKKNPSKKYLGPVVQSIVSLTKSLRVISLTVLADSIYNSLIFFAEKMWVAFAKATHIFSAKYFSIFAYHTM